METTILLQFEPFCDALFWFVNTTRKHLLTKLKDDLKNRVFSLETMNH